MGAFLKTRGFEDLALLAEDFELLFELLLDAGDGAVHAVAAGDEVLRGEDVDLVALGQDFAGQRIEFDNPLNFVAEEIDTHSEFVVAWNHGK